MLSYKTNPKIRCHKCNGREVITLKEGVPVYNSIWKTPNGYECKDEKECKQNIDAENTIIDYEEGEDGKPRMTQVTKYGKTIMEVDYDT